MARPEGFLWSDPGIPSLTVPYHDTNDFYFSGHVGAAVLWMHEFYANDYKIMVIITFTIMCTEWIMLTLLRVHYIIDLVSGLMIAHLCVMQTEWICYYIDVKICGWSGKDRK